MVGHSRHRPRPEPTPIAVSSQTHLQRPARNRAERIWQGYGLHPAIPPLAVLRVYVMGFISGALLQPGIGEPREGTQRAPKRARRLPGDQRRVKQGARGSAVLCETCARKRTVK